MAKRQRKVAKSHMPGEYATALLRFGQENTNNSSRDQKNRVPRTSKSENDREPEWEKHWIRGQKTGI